MYIIQHRHSSDNEHINKHMHLSSSDSCENNILQSTDTYVPQTQSVFTTRKRPIRTSAYLNLLTHVEHTTIGYPCHTSHNQLHAILAKVTLNNWRSRPWVCAPDIVFGPFQEGREKDPDTGGN